MRLDKRVALDHPEISRSQVKKMIENGFVLVNGNRAKCSHDLKEKDLVTVESPSELGFKSEAFDLEVLYEDKACMVLNKPVGMVVHPDEGGRYAVGTVAHKINSFGGVLVHRLDKDTSGCLLVAKNTEAYEALKAQFKDRQVEKIYLSLVKGVPEHDEGVIDSPIARDRMKMALSSTGRKALSHYKVLEKFEEYCLVQVRIETGRTHQIRVHMAAIGHPVLGDGTYGDRRLNKRLGVDRQLLHAWKLSFESPDTGKNVNVESEMPDRFKPLLSS